MIKSCSNFMRCFSILKGQIVTCIVTQNQNEEYLLMQEKKKKYHGKWFFPAGKIEGNENIYDGAIRECFEETGLIFKPSTCFNVRYLTLEQISKVYDFSSEMEKKNFDFWVCFYLKGKVVGGELKISEDEHSIEAGFFSEEEIRKMEETNMLRSKEVILDIISWYKEREGIDLTFHTSSKKMSI